VTERGLEPFSGKSSVNSGAQRPPTSEPPWRLTIVVAACAGVVYLLRYVLTPFVFGAAVVFILDPVALWIMRQWHVPRWLAALIVFGAFVGLIGAGGYWFVTALWSDVVRLSQDSSTIIRRLLEAVIGPGDRQFFGQKLNAADLSQQITAGLGSAVRTPGQLLQLAAIAVSGGMGVFLTLVVAFFGLFSRPRIERGLLWLVPPRHRFEAQRFAAALVPVLRCYFLGVATIVAITTALAWVALDRVLGLPHAFLLALITGVLELVPVIGPTSSIVIVSFFAVAEGTVWMIGGVAVFFICQRLVIDQIVGPLILGKAVVLHPLTVLFAMLAGMVLFGFLGVVLAVPVSAAIKLALRQRYESPAVTQTELPPSPPAEGW
jgi:predicted PurR-regulated permease PerM